MVPLNPSKTPGDEILLTLDDGLSSLVVDLLLGRIYVKDAVEGELIAG